MAMTKRERILALGVGVTIGLFAVQYGFNSLKNSLQQKQDLADAAQAEFDRVNKIETSGLIAAEKINALKTKSLPTQMETLVAQYRDWLFKLGEESGLSDIKVVPPNGPSASSSKAYAAYDFKLSGYCRTDQVVDLLARFYDKNYLHTIKTLKLNQTKERNVLNVVLDAQALALKGADANQEPAAEPSGRLAMSPDEYKLAILNRNPFAPPNQKPKLATSRTHEIKRGESWSLSLEANDPENQAIDFELVSTELPEGLSFRRGAFSWRPTENGEYEVEIRAKDRGWPSQTVEEKLTLRVVDPPAEEPKVEPPAFDVASQAFVSAMLKGRGGPEAWIRSRTDGKTLQLSEGSDFELGSIKAKVVGINLKEDFLELETDGRRWTIGMDTSLADAFKRSQID